MKFSELIRQYLQNGGDGSIRQPAATQFLECLNKQKTIEDCLQCFPYQVLRPECPIEKFYNFYNL